MMRHKTNFDKVREFHKAFGLDVDQPLTPEKLELRMSLIREEYVEVTEEVYLSNGEKPTYPEEISPNLVKELTDLLYVVYGTGVSLGIDLDTAFNRTHMSNMSKLGADGKPIYREDGKALKGPNYKPPSMDDLVPKL